MVLFNDTYNEHYCPEIGIAAVQVLEALGFEVIVPPKACCGRPLISKGFLKKAKAKAEKLITLLTPYALDPIIILEPSCLSAITDDFEGLLGYNHQGLALVKKQCHSFESFITSRLDSLTLKPLETALQFHGHCHEKSLPKSFSLQNLLTCLTHSKASIIPSGCCGMAGSFGYEKEHYALSLKIGNLKLFPAIQKSPDCLIIANGFSCRAQIEHATHKKALHIAEVVKMVL